jgi:hypothetical protein
MWKKTQETIARIEELTWVLNSFCTRELGETQRAFIKKRIEALQEKLK